MRRIAVRQWRFFVAVASLAVVPGIAFAAALDGELASGLGDVQAGSGYTFPGTGLWVGGDITLNTTLPEEGDASLELDDINALIRYEPIPRLAFFSETRLENTLKVSEDGGAQTESADVKIERLYADWLVGPHFTIRVGKFLTPFGIWNVIRRAPLTWTVERPLVTENTFPEHATGLSLIYQATLQGWSIDGTVYGPMQDALPLRSSDERDTPMVGGRVAAAHDVGSAYLSLGLSVAGAERRDHGGLQPIAGADFDLNLHGNDLTGEFVYARSSETGASDDWGSYVQDAFPLLSSLYGVVRFEYFRSFDHEELIGGLLGLEWRPRPYLIIKGDYQFGSESTEDFQRGFVGSLALFF